MSPGELGGPGSAGSPAKHRGRPRDDALEEQVETHCTESMLQKCLGNGQAVDRGDFVPMIIPTAHIERIRALGYTEESNFQSTWIES